MAMPEDAATERDAIRTSFGYIHPATINADGSFNNIDYKDTEGCMEHGERLSKLIQAYYLNLTVDYIENYFYQNASTWKWIAKSWEFVAYSAPDVTDWNWWTAQIGTPRSFWQGLFLSRGKISDKLYDHMIKRYWTDAQVWNISTIDGKMSASNLANRGFLGLFETFYQSEGQFSDRRNSLIELLKHEIINKAAYQGEGVGPDYCIHIHNIHEGVWEVPYYSSHLRRMIYNGGYGAEYLKRFAYIYILLRNTEYQEDEVMLSEFINCFLECHQYLVRGKTFEPSAVGRNIADDERVTYWAAYDSVYKVAELLLQLDFRKEELENVITRYQNNGPTSASNALIGNRGLFASDMMVHHRLGYMASVRMFSTRTVRPETWVNPRRTINPYGYYFGDGFVFLTRDDNEFGIRHNEVFKYYDWEKIPGTTVVYSGDVPQEGMERVGGTPNYPHHISNAKFVGSASDGMYGAAAMVYDRPTVNITMKKSWFLFDDEIVCLGSDLSLRENYTSLGLPIITTLNQIVQDGDIVYMAPTGSWQYADWNNTTSVPNARWIHHDNMGYVFPNGADATIDSYEKTANDKKINLTAMFMEHGLEPYAYIIYPNVTLNQIEKLHANPSVMILQQDTNAHVVYQTTLHMLAMVVFSAPFSILHPEFAYSITVDLACILMFQKIDNNISVTVSFPTQLASTVNITLGMKVKGVDSYINPSEGTSVVLFNFSDDRMVAGKSQTKNYEIVELSTSASLTQLPTSATIPGDVPTATDIVSNSSPESPTKLPTSATIPGDVPTATDIVSNTSPESSTKLPTSATTPVDASTATVTLSNTTPASPTQLPTSEIIPVDVSTATGTVSNTSPASPTRLLTSATTPVDVVIVSNTSASSTQLPTNTTVSVDASTATVIVYTTVAFAGIIVAAVITVAVSAVVHETRRVKKIIKRVKDSSMNNDTPLIR
ncbi:unnamed protein product [Owenia fusiformis]|uniref:Uncharacterized protein n=1 Tax=Owenia fusiformis TaxID=6347 RepID=A0A8J1XTH5_OWEFU|nr:unnamed protein product [Owenia fusiformis]